MIERKRVAAAGYGGNGLWNIFTGRKKYSIVCGSCGHTWSDKVPFEAGDVASSICPCCGAQNIWSHSEFSKLYEKQIAG
jgi:hypothetical protein